MKPIFIGGMGLFTPGYPNIRAWAERQPSPANAPSAALMPPALKRRASSLTRMVADAVMEAAREGQADLNTIPTVYASAWGEIVTTLEILRQVEAEAEGMPSPTLFHNSVHNTSAGYVSIAAKNRSFSTSLAAGFKSVAMGLIEAGALLNERGNDVLLILADEPPPAPFAPGVPYPPLAIAFHLSASPLPTSRGRLAWPCISDGRSGVIASFLSKLGAFAGNPCAAGLLLVEALLMRAAGPVPVSLVGEADWVDLEPL